MHPRNFTIPTLILLWTVPFFVTAAATAEDRQSENLAVGDDGIIIDTIDVNVVNVEVYVTDKKGNRISGLTQDDFILEVDKKPVGITNFYVVENGVAQGEGLEMLPPAEPVIPGRRQPETPPVPDDQQLHLIVYIDNMNLHPFTRNKAFRFIRTFLRERVSDNDQVMLVTYERSIHERVPFTSDAEIVASALYEIETHSAHAVHFDSDRRDILDAIYEDDERNGLNRVRGRAITYVESLYNDMSFTLRAIDGLVERLAGLPGRKAILYISDGLSMRPGEDIFYALDDRFRNRGSDPGASSMLMEIHRYDMSRDFQRLTTKANTNRVSFYTLDAAGLRTYSYMDASNATANGGAFIDQVHFSNLQNSLVYMANETGGTVILNTNDFTKGLNKVADDFSSYYSLGFSSGSAESGRYHNIQVKVKGQKEKKYRVRHREGFRDKPVSSRMSDGTLAALHFGYQRNALEIEIEFGRGKPEDKGKRFLVPIAVKIPIGKLSFLPQAEFHRGRVRLYVAALDDEGGVSPVQDVPIPIDIPVSEFETAKGQFYKYEMTLQMRRGRQVVAVGVRDEIGATSGFVTRGMTVGSGRGP